MTRRINAPNWFGRQKAERLVHTPSLDPAVAYGGVFKPSWENRPVPMPGPMAYAYEGLTQQAQGMFGRGGIPYGGGGLRITSTPKIALATQVRQGLGAQFGTFWLQPLYDAKAGTGS